MGKAGSCGSQRKAVLEIGSSVCPGRGFGELGLEQDLSASGQVY